MGLSFFAKIVERIPSLLCAVLLWSIAASGAAFATAEDDVAAGRAALNTEQPGEAIRLFTQAIGSGELADSQISTAYYFRGIANRSLGDYDAAIADFTQTISFTPEADYAYSDRGVAFFAAGRFTEARADFDSQIQLGGSNLFNLLWRYVAATRAGEQGADQLALDSSILERSLWPGIVIDFYLGHVTAEAVEAAAAEGSEDMRSFRTCIADFFIGEQNLTQSNYDEAHSRFGRALMNCPPNSQTYAAANAELARLNDRLASTAMAEAVPFPQTDASVAPADQSFFDPNATTYPDLPTGSGVNLFEKVDWAAATSVDLVFLPAATFFKQLFLEIDLLLYWGLLLAAAGLALWYVIRPVLSWIKRYILMPIARFLRRIGVFIGRVLVVALMAYLALMGLWTLAIEQDWLNGAGLLAGFGLLTYVTTRHFLSGGDNELFDVSMEVKDLADEYAELTESF
jgi:lipoprotein NlpI